MPEVFLLSLEISQSAFTDRNIEEREIAIKLRFMIKSIFFEPYTHAPNVATPLPQTSISALSPTPTSVGGFLHDGFN